MQAVEHTEPAVGYTVQVVGVVDKPLVGQLAVDTVVQAVVVDIDSGSVAVVAAAAAAVVELVGPPASLTSRGTDYCYPHSQKPLVCLPRFQNPLAFRGVLNLHKWMIN